ncbi:MAG: DUF748 domain-containing protein [Candidatus Omnitrophota bacterium]
MWRCKLLARFPLNFKIKKLRIGSLMRADSIYISTSLLGFLSGSVVFNEIKFSKPEFVYEIFSTLSKSALPDNMISASTSSPQTEKARKLRLLFKRIKITDGKVKIIDHTVEKEALEILINDINLNVENLYLFPASVKTNFSLSGRIPWQQDQEEGKIEAEGWINLSKKDMQAVLKIKDIDGIYLYPYYSNWVDLEKACIESAKLNFNSDIKGENNDIVAKCHLELADIVRRERSAEEPAEKAEKITDAVLEIFKAMNQGKIVLDFKIRTKMDSPKFGFSDIRAAFEGKLAEGHTGFSFADIITFPKKVFDTTVQSATGVSKAVFNGTMAVGKEIKEIVEDTFKAEIQED